MIICKEAQELLEKANSDGFMSNDDFAGFMTNVLVSEGGYVMGTGSGEWVNAEIARRLARNIIKHPILWNWFMVG